MKLQIHLLMQSKVSKALKAINFGFNQINLVVFKKEAKLKKLHNMVSEKQKWFDECHTKLSSASLSDDPPVTTSDIKEQIDALESMTQSIYNDIQRKKLEKQREEEKKKFEEKVKKKEAEKKEENKKDAKSKNEEANTNFTPNEPMDVD